MFRLMIEGWLGIVIHMVSFPFVGMSIALYFSHLCGKSAVVPYTLKESWDYLLKHFWVIFWALSINAVVVCLLARLTDQDSSYTFLDLLMFPFYTLAWLALAEAVYYFVHRAMHKIPVLWKWIHELHHSTEYTGCMSSIHIHPLELMVFFGGPLPLVLGLGKRLHLWNFYGTLFVQFFLAYYQHSGSVVMVLPDWLFAEPLKHELHHRAHGNYASFFRFWDWFMGTAVHPGKEKEFLESLRDGKIAKNSTKVSEKDQASMLSYKRVKLN
jgi:sterol desaturase/sphingolipid hydroxylase (fatty acid hydroxylase superfamily)